MPAGQRALDPPPPSPRLCLGGFNRIGSLNPDYFMHKRKNLWEGKCFWSPCLWLAFISRLYFPAKKYLNTAINICFNHRKRHSFSQITSYAILPSDGRLLKGDFLFFIGFLFFMYDIQHCFICSPSDFTMSEDAGIEPRTVATTALAVRRSNHSARSHSHSNRYPLHPV